MKYGFLVAFAAISCLPGLAAAENTITMSAAGGDVSLDLQNVGATEETRGVEVSLEGRAGGLRYDFSVARMGTSSETVTSLDVNTSWLVGGVAGPGIRHVRADVTESGVTFAGLSARHEFPGMTFYGDAMSDVENFGDTNLYKMGVSGDFFGLHPYAEIQRLEQSSANGTDAEIGLRVPVGDALSLYGAASRSTSSRGAIDLEARSVRGGLSFKF